MQYAFTHITLQQAVLISDGTIIESNHNIDLKR